MFFLNRTIKIIALVGLAFGLTNPLIAMHNTQDKSLNRLKVIFNHIDPEHRAPHHLDLNSDHKTDKPLNSLIEDQKKELAQAKREFRNFAIVFGISALGAINLLTQFPPHERWQALLAIVSTSTCAASANCLALTYSNPLPGFLRGGVLDAANMDNYIKDGFMRNYYIYGKSLLTNASWKTLAQAFVNTKQGKTALFLAILSALHWLPQRMGARQAEDHLKIFAGCAAGSIACGALALVQSLPELYLKYSKLYPGPKYNKSNMVEILKKLESTAAKAK